jgi:hypothetical protein
MLGIPHCLDNRLTDCGKVVSPTRRPSSTPQKLFFLLLVLISVKDCANPNGLLRPEGISKLKKFIHLIGSRTRDLPAVAWYLNLYATMRPLFLRAQTIIMSRSSEVSIATDYGMDYRGVGVRVPVL